MPMEAIWDILSEQLHFVAHAYQIQFHLFVAMSNHFHAIASADPPLLSAGMQYFLSQTSRLITKSSGRINHTWRARFYRSQILTTQHYLHAYKYFYRNPVEAGLCSRVEDYPYSTLHGLIGRRPLLIPVVHDDTLFSDFEGTLEWLNKKPECSHREAIRKALRRRKFKLPRDSKTTHLHPLESARY